MNGKAIATMPSSITLFLGNFQNQPPHQPVEHVNSGTAVKTPPSVGLKP
jgi:hypothetical protein